MLDVNRATARQGGRVEMGSCALGWGAFLVPCRWVPRRRGIGRASDSVRAKVAPRHRARTLLRLSLDGHEKVIAMMKKLK